MADPEGVAAGGVVPIEACSCVTDPFAAVPPELQPRPQRRDSLRKVGFPGCGKEYFTNREKDLCISCERIENEGRGSQESK